MRQSNQICDDDVAACVCMILFLSRSLSCHKLFHLNSLAVQVVDDELSTQQKCRGKWSWIQNLAEPVFMCVVHILSGYYCLKIVWCGCWLLPLLDITSSDSIRMCEHAFAHLLTTNNLSTWCLTVSVMPVSRKKKMYITRQPSAHTHTVRYDVIRAAFFHLTFSWARRKKRRFIVNQPDNMILNLS